MAAATLVVVPFCLPAMIPALQHPSRLFPALLVASLASALPFSLEMAALRRMSTCAFGILMSLEPAVAALSGLLLGEQLPAERWLGIGSVVRASAGTALAGNGKPVERPKQAKATLKPLLRNSNDT